MILDDHGKYLGNRMHKNIMLILISILIFRSLLNNHHIIVQLLDLNLH